MGWGGPAQLDDLSGENDTVRDVLGGWMTYQEKMTRSVTFWVGGVNAEVHGVSPFVTSNGQQASAVCGPGENARDHVSPMQTRRQGCWHDKKRPDTFSSSKWANSCLT